MAAERDPPPAALRATGPPVPWWRRLSVRAAVVAALVAAMVAYWSRYAQ